MTDNLFDDIKAKIESAIAEPLFNSESTAGFTFIFELACSIHQKIPRSEMLPSTEGCFAVKWSRDCKDQNLGLKVILYELNFSFRGITYYVFDICAHSFKWEDPDLMPYLDDITSRHAIL